MAVACSDSESTPIETLTQLESIDYTTSTYLSGEYLIADSEIFQLDGTKTTSLGSLPDAKRVGRIGADLWACGGSKDGFWVSKKVGEIWSMPLNLGSPRPEETPEEQMMTDFPATYSYDCSVTSEGFVFQHIEERDDGPYGWEYGAFATDSTLTEISDASSQGSIIGWNDTIGHFANFYDGLGFQALGEEPVILSTETAWSFRSAQRDGMAYVAHAIAGPTTIARIEDNSLVAETTADLYFGWKHGLEISPQGNPILLASRTGQAVLWTPTQQFDVSNDVKGLSAHGNFVYLLDRDKVLVFEFR